jgi:hypothetical protein
MDELNTKATVTRICSLRMALKRSRISEAARDEIEDAIQIATNTLHEATVRACLAVGLLVRHKSESGQLLDLAPMFQGGSRTGLVAASHQSRTSNGTLFYQQLLKMCWTGLIHTTSPIPLVLQAFELFRTTAFPSGFQPLPIPTTNLVRLIELRAKELDTEYANLLSKYDELVEAYLEWNEVAPTPTGNALQDFYTVNITPDGSWKFSASPLSSFKTRGTLFSVDALSACIRQYCSEPVKKELERRFGQLNTWRGNFQGVMDDLLLQRKRRRGSNNGFPQLNTTNTFRVVGTALHRHYSHHTRPALPKTADARKAALKKLNSAPLLDTYIAEQGRFAQPKRIIGIDLGETFTVGACMLQMKNGYFKNYTVRQRHLRSGTYDASMELELRKEMSGINDFESDLSQHEKNAKSFQDFQAYVQVRQIVHPELFEFYNTRHNHNESWRSKRVKQSRFSQVFHQLLKLAKLPGHRRLTQQEKSSALFVIGDASFQGQRGRPSEHASFLSYFLRMARGLGLRVVSIEEPFTSQKCPRCLGQMEQRTMRIKYCPSCSKYYHRDVAAGECMALIAWSIIEGRGRPPQFW